MPGGVEKEDTLKLLEERLHLHQQSTTKQLAESLTALALQLPELFKSSAEIAMPK
jgi:hypothetical protein